MALVNMKMSAEEAKEQAGSIASDAPEYPYGLCLNLDEDALKKLGGIALPKVGETMMITARVVVKSVSEYETMQGGKEQNVSLQITDMEMGADKPEKSAESALYGEKA